MPIHNWNFRNQQDPVRYLEHSGLRIGVALGPHHYLADTMKAGNLPVPEAVQCSALIDTGCTRTSIDRSLAERLGLMPIGQTPCATASGVVDCPTYAFSIEVAGGPRLDCIEGIGHDLSGTGVGALIGMDLLVQCILVVNGPDASFSLAI